MLIGSHVSMNGKKMLEASAETAASYGGNTFMIYTGAPQNTRRKPIEELNIERGQEAMERYGISNIVVHAPYIINIANTTREGVFDHGVAFLIEEIKRTEALGANQIVLHPGAHVGAGAEVGIQSIIKGLNIVLEEDHDVQIALETMAGKGSEIGRSFEEIAEIIHGVANNDRLSVTFDTCHVHDAGYDIKNDLDGVLTEFDKIIGLERIKVIHINDSKNESGAKKDRHENFGFGHIGFDALMNVIHHEAFEELPKILETPFVGPDKKDKQAPYKHEIEMIKSGQFNPKILTKINPNMINV